MGKQVHYEVFVRRGQSKNWSLFDATPKRDEALETAKAELAKGLVTGVRVVKETYDEASGDFMNLTIFEDGARKIATKREAEDAPPLLPCIVPDDLYSVHARHTMGRLFVDVLARWKLTVTELIHRADSLEKLEATGTIFQHAVQKVAIAQSSSTGVPLIQIIRATNELADRAIQRVYREDRAKRVVACESAAELAAFAEARADDASGGLLIGMAFARYLAPAASWGEKLDLVLHVLATPPQSEKAAKIVVQMADAIVGEILAGASALQELLGPMPDLGTALVSMSDLYLGRAPSGRGQSVLARLGSFFGKDRLLDARTALARRVLAELRTHKRLGASVAIETQHLRAITARLVAGPSQLVPHQDIVSAITMRSRRLVDGEAISDYLSGSTTPLEKVDRLLNLAENVVGAENKRRLYDYLRPILTSAQLEAALADPKLNLMERLERAGQLQSKILKSTLADASRSEGAAVIDDVVRRTLDLGRLATTMLAPAAIQSLREGLEAGTLPRGAEPVLRDLLKQSRAA